MIATPHLAAFQVQKLLFSTATTALWRGFQPKLDRPVLLLTTCTIAEQDADFRRKTFEVIRTLTHVKSALVPEILDVVREGTHIYIILEDANIVALRTVLKGKPLTPAQFTTLLKQLAQGLSTLQSAGISCETLTPDHLFISETSTLVLPDITAFRAQTPAAPNESSPLFARDLLWCAPEQCCHPPLLPDTRSAMYAVGLTFYALATAQIPFGALPQRALLSVKQQRQVPSPCDIIPQFPEVLAAILSRMTQRTAEQRYPQWGDLLHDLYLAEQGIQPPIRSPETATIAPPFPHPTASGRRVHCHHASEMRLYRERCQRETAFPKSLRFILSLLLFLIVTALLLIVWTTFL